MITHIGIQFGCANNNITVIIIIISSSIVVIIFAVNVMAIIDILEDLGISTDIIYTIPFRSIIVFDLDIVIQFA